MIVDDDAFVSLELSELLTAIGYDVVGMASSGKDGVEMARDVRPDLILMDVILPGEPGGIEAAEEIMSQLDIPVIFITGYHSCPKSVLKAQFI
jgi:chemotaxis response regulator CheB